MEKYSTKENETYREHAEKAVHKAEEHGQKARHNLQENMQKLNRHRGGKRGKDGCPQNGRQN